MVKSGRYDFVGRTVRAASRDNGPDADGGCGRRPAGAVVTAGRVMPIGPGAGRLVHTWAPRPQGVVNTKSARFGPAAVTSKVSSLLSL
jgi:hypothetical protein